MEKDFNKIIQKLRNTEPVPQNPQQLTRNIMEQIQWMDGRHSWLDLLDLHWNMFVRIRTAISVGACLLLLVFLSEQIPLQKFNHSSDQVGIEVTSTIRNDYTRTLMEQMPLEEIQNGMSPFALIRAYDHAKDRIQARKEELIKSYLK